MTSKAYENVIALNNLIPTAKSFGAVGNGVTNDTLAFREIEKSNAEIIDLSSGSYVLTSTWSDPVNGVRLTKDYKNGVLIVDGRRLIMDLDFGLAASGSSRARIPYSYDQKQIGLFKQSDNQYYVWRALVKPAWLRYGLARSGSGIPFNLNEMFIKQVLQYKAARDSGVSYTGTWASDTTTTALISGDPQTYISGRAQQATTPGDYVEITFTGGGDLYVVFVGRASGNYVNVLLDGSQDYLILPDDGSGNSYFDSYTAADLSYKQVIQIASSVPNGSHTIRLTLSSLKNSNSSGGRFIFNAVSWSNENTGPWSAEADAIIWSSGEAVLQNQERKNGFNYYFATGAGTTGATPPTHTSGTVSDGGVSWTYKPVSSYELLDHRIQAPGSQLEYAYEIRPTGASSFEDVGGALHGNETQTALQIMLGSSIVNPPLQKWLAGDSVNFIENIDVNHSQIGGGATVVNKTILRRTFAPSGVEIQHTHKLQTAGQFGYFYAHMWPLLHYSSIGAKYGILSLWSPSDGERICADFYGANNPFVGRTKDTIMIAEGECLQPNGSAGVPTTIKAPLRFAATLSVSPDSVDYYRTSKSTFAAKAMNTSAANVSSGGFSSMTSKMYFTRNDTLVPTPYSAGDTITCTARYEFDIYGNSVFSI
jgi:hypothetical protein